jgi:ferredoxin
MATRVDPKLKNDLKEFGIEEWNECYHCGVCTAVCAHSEEEVTFPRKTLRLVQMGLKDKLTTRVEPWLCYYCGSCSDQCPRNANPGEMMMVLRRYLTSTYDWTGLSRKFYTSRTWELFFVMVIAMVVAAVFLILLPPSGGIFTNPEMFINAQGGVMINSMVQGIGPNEFVRIIEIFDWSMAAVVAGLLTSNIIRMFYLVVIRDKTIKVPIYAYFTELWNLIWHFSTQAKFAKCDDKKYWLGHLLLMTGYTIMFVLIVVALPEFQIEEIKEWYHWQRLLGYYATFGILFFLTFVTVKRFKREDVKSKFTHVSDWLFIIMLGLTTLTGILIHLFRINGLPVATYVTYLMHLMVLTPMILIEVPFSKWSHLAYRPFAIYFDRLRKYKKYTGL